MRSLSIKPGQVIEQLLVEQMHIGKQQILVIGNELLLNAAIESFNMGIHLGSPGIGQPTAYLILRHLGIECRLELAAIARQRVQYVSGGRQRPCAGLMMPL